MVRTFLVALVLLGATSSVMANGIDDFEGCKAAATERIPVDVALKAGFCTGIVEGLMWSLPGWGIVCLPKGVITGQGLKVLVKYMDDHPEELHERTAELAFRAFAKAWPCSR
jgi:Rap1a immunity proteins